MKQLAIALLLLPKFLLASIFGCSNPINHELKEYKEFRHLYKTRKIYNMLIDTRSEREFTNEHLKGAINIPIEKLKELKKISDIKEYYGNKDASGLILFFYSDNSSSTKEVQKTIDKLVENTYFYYNSCTFYYMKDGYVGNSSK